MLKSEIESKSAKPHGAGNGVLAVAGMTKEDQFNGSGRLGSRQQRRKKVRKLLKRKYLNVSIV